ncbi:MAG: 23S rRNA (uracil(1939)-C(5))-methyltransferase RlmD [Terriglobales bacterium]|nr:23S rRNA (uracil(1939)-C(5))-methyltransferase RlmD [Terriglobales bacterium]
MQLIIEKLIYGGDGLARLPADDQGRGKAVFVPFVLEGEAVGISLTEQKPGFARGVVNEILAPSAHRIEPHCPYFMRCGGCHYQHSSYSHQLEIKAAILRENLRRIAKLELETELQIHPSPEWNYRNRSRFTVRFEPEFGLCYHKFNSNQLLPVEQCPISSPLINQVLQALWAMGRAGEMPKDIRELELFANADDTGLLIEAYCADEASNNVIEQFGHDCQSRIPAIFGVVAFKNRPAPAREERFAAVGKKEIEYKTLQGSYRVSAGSFFQVNRHLIDELVNIVTGGRSGETVLDLYAGVGLFSSVLNRDFHRVIAVESSQPSYSDLLYNSAPNVKAVHATTEHYLESMPRKLRPDFVVLDPPRSGLSANALKGLVALNAPEITYISCDPATLARDMRGLLNSGYQLKQAHLIDLFPQTFHIESAFHLTR